MTTNFNTSPYFDDFDEANQFYKILFRPAYAVQNRELIQLQTILQNQIAKFGNHIFANGSMVIPGNTTYDTNYHYVKISILGENKTLADFTGTVITGTDSNVTAEVIQAIDVEDDDPITFFVKYLSSGTNGESVFDDGEVVFTNTDGSTATLALTDATGTGSAASISDGVFYVNGIMAKCNTQTVILDKYSITPSYKVGLEVFDTIVTPEDDFDLHDNAQGTPNYAAPGAHRHKMDLVLTKRLIESEADTNFIELQRVVNGEMISHIRTPDYGELKKEFARRTFNESGHYTVKPFLATAREHYYEADTQYHDGVFSAGDGGDQTKIAITLTPGTVYVNGFEIISTATKIVELDKARDTQSRTNTVTRIVHGNYIEVTNFATTVSEASFFNLGQFGSIDLVDDGTYGVIGSARIKYFQYSSGTIGLDTAHYKLYLFDTTMDEPGVSGKEWFNVESIASTDGHFTADVVDVVINTEEIQLYETNNNALLYNVEDIFIKSMADFTFECQIAFQGTASGNIITFNTGANETFNSFSNDYIIYNATQQNFLDIDTVEFPVASQIRLTDAGIADTDVIHMYAPVLKTNPSVKIKTKWTDIVEAGLSLTNGVAKLNKADIIRIVSIIGDDSGVDYSGRFYFDDGQRDNFYDVGRIILKGGSIAPAETFTITYDYFAHGAGDFFCVNSYNSIEYGEIPAFASPSTGLNYHLADCLDFRPRIDNTGVNFTGTGSSLNDLPLHTSNAILDYDSYLPRRDKLVVDEHGSFTVIKGISSLNPAYPRIPNNAMELYSIDISPYTITPSNVNLTLTDNKRYTMRDIGALEKRINNIEYYTSLTMLEKATSDILIVDEFGLDRFKNGFIVDNFRSLGVGDSVHDDYKCSLDTDMGEMRPTFHRSLFDLELNNTLSSDIKQTGAIVTLPYTEVEVISQPFASRTENVNPFHIRSFNGAIHFNPASDNWFETKRVPDLLVNNDDQYEAMQALVDANKDIGVVTWNNWTTDWVGQNVVTGVSTSVGDWRTVGSTSRTSSRFLGGRGWGPILNTTTTTTTLNRSVTTATTLTRDVGQTRTGTMVVPVTSSVTESLGDKIINTNVIPFMRSIDILCKAVALRPNTKMYPFFDGVDITDHCTRIDLLTISNKVGLFEDDINRPEPVTFLSPSNNNVTGLVVIDNENTLQIVNLSTPLVNVGVETISITGSLSGATANLLTQTSYSSSDPLITNTAGEIAFIFTVPSE